MKKKKILLISYGGTIVMVVRNKVVVPADNIEEIFAMVPRINDVADVHLEILSNVDSTNVAPHDWTKMANFIAKKMDDYDGFVIAHGTNTMAYTASALALALGAGLQKPVVITGSQLPLMTYGDDARNNLEYAVKTAVKAVECKIAEVMIVFGNVILRGSRSVKISEDSFRAFDSPAENHLGMISARGIRFNQYAKKVDPKIKFKCVPHFELGILSVDMVPGQSPELIDTVLESGRCKGVIMKSHGAGSVPNIGTFSFIDLIKRSVTEYLVPVLVSTKFLGGNSHKDTNDEPAVQALEAGAISTYDMTEVMAEVKLMWLLAQGHRDVGVLRELIKKKYVEEISVF